MSDRDVRAGVRALLAGGLAQLTDDQVQRLHEDVLGENMRRHAAKAKTDDAAAAEWAKANPLALWAHIHGGKKWHLWGPTVGVPDDWTTLRPRCSTRPHYEPRFVVADAQHSEKPAYVARRCPKCHAIWRRMGRDA